MVTPSLLFADKFSTIEIIGGTDVKWSPPSFHLYAFCKHFLTKMGINVNYEVKEGGYFCG